MKTGCTGSKYINNIDMIYIRTMPSVWKAEKKVIYDQSGNILYKLQRLFSRKKYRIFDSEGYLIGDCEFEYFKRRKLQSVVLNIGSRQYIIGLTFSAEKKGRLLLEIEQLPYSFLVDPYVCEIEVVDNGSGRILAVSKDVFTELGWMPENKDIRLIGNFDRETVALVLALFTMFRPSGSIMTIE